MLLILLLLLLLSLLLLLLLLLLLPLELHHPLLLPPPPLLLFLLLPLFLGPTAPPLFLPLPSLPLLSHPPRLLFLNQLPAPLLLPAELQRKLLVPLPLLRELCHLGLQVSTSLLLSLSARAHPSHILALREIALALCTEREEAAKRVLNRGGRHRHRPACRAAAPAVNGGFFFPFLVPSPCGVRQRLYPLAEDVVASFAHSFAQRLGRNPGCERAARASPSNAPTPTTELFVI